MSRTRFMNLAIIGAAELGKLVAHHAAHDSRMNIVGFYDDFNDGQEFCNYPILGKASRVIKDFEGGRFEAVFIAIGYSQMKARVKYYEALKGRVPLANIIHSSSYVDRSCQLGEGVFILPGCSLDFEAAINDNVLLNTGVTIAHHSTVGKNSFVAPGCQIAGLVTIGENCFIGVGATIKDSITIHKNSTIGAGAVVIKDTPENSVSVGVPAKVIKIKSND